MRLLLDTHVFLWLAIEPESLSARARALCQDPEHELLLSFASIWELQIKQQFGPHPANPSLDEYWLPEPGVPVWAIIGGYRAEGGNVDDVAAAYHLLREQVEAALAYYQRHRTLIDNRLAQNQPA